MTIPHGGHTAASWRVRIWAGACTKSPNVRMKIVNLNNMNAYFLDHFYI